jgi:hypothetical protein
MLIHGHTSDELARKTRELIAAFSEAGITLNVKKIVYDKPEVVFGGYLINETEMLLIWLSQLHCQNFQYQSHKQTSGHFVDLPIRCAIFQMTSQKHWRLLNTC